MGYPRARPLLTSKSSEWLGGQELLYFLGCTEFTHRLFDSSN